MPGYVKDILLLTLMIGTGIFVQRQWSELTGRMGRLEATKTEFAQQAQEAVNATKQADYLSRIQDLLRLYKRNVTEIQGRRVEWSDELQDKIDRQVDNGVIDETQHEKTTEILALAKSAYETLLEARWESQLTSPGEGDTRLDVYRIREKDRPSSPVRLEAYFFLWGIEPDTVVTWGRQRIKFWSVSDGIDAPTAVGEHESSASPSVFVQNPKGFVLPFPPDVAIGALELPALPESAVSMDFELEYTVRKGDQEHVSRLVWTKTPIPAQWRPSEGKTDDAEVAN